MILLSLVWHAEVTQLTYPSWAILRERTISSTQHTITSYLVLIYFSSYYRGRGAFESMGAGLEMIPGDIAFKVGSSMKILLRIISCFVCFISSVILFYSFSFSSASASASLISYVLSLYALQSNFATLDPATGIVLRRRCDRNFEHWGPPLCSFLSGMKLPSFPDHQVDVKYATEHR